MASPSNHRRKGPGALKVAPQQNRSAPAAPTIPAQAQPSPSLSADPALADQLRENPDSFPSTRQAPHTQGWTQRCSADVSGPTSALRMEAWLPALPTKVMACVKDRQNPSGNSHLSGPGFLICEMGRKEVIRSNPQFCSSVAGKTRTLCFEVRSCGGEAGGEAWLRRVGGAAPPPALSSPPPLRPPLPPGHLCPFLSGPAPPPPHPPPSQRPASQETRGLLCLCQNCDFRLGFIFLSVT